MSDFDRRRDIEAEGQRALMVPSKPDLSNMGKGTAYKIGYRQGQADAISAAMELPEVRALVQAVRAEALARNLYLATPPDRGGVYGPKGQRKQALETAQVATAAALAQFTEAKP